MDIEELAARLQRMEDIEAIRSLKMRYCSACDDNYNPEAIAACFTEDAVWDAGMFGICEGRQQIREYFAAAPDNISFAIHQVSNPSIEVDGDSAHGQWYLLQPMVMRATDRAYWLAALYRERYRRVDGQWLIEHLALTIRAMSPYEKGFAIERIAEL